MRLSLITWLVIFWAMVFSAWCFALAADLDFSLSLDKAEYQTNEPINATFKLENKTKTAVYVNKRFYLNSEALPPQSREAYLVVTSPSGIKLPCKFRYETGLPKSDYFELLEPAKEVVSEYKRDLRGYFDFNEEGTYKIMAVYENVYGQELGLEVFKDKISAAPVTCKIIKPVSGK